jgi:anti-sigma factor RsiW
VTYAEGPTSGGVGSDHSQRSRGVVGLEVAELGHDEVHGLLSDFLAETLDETQAARVAGHLRTCASCATDLLTLQRTVDLLRDLPGQRAPDSLRRRLLAIPDAEQATPR